MILNWLHFTTRGNKVEAFHQQIWGCRNGKGYYTCR